MTPGWEPESWKEKEKLLKSLRFVVGGCVRGGTTYFANALRKCLPDWRIGHETIFNRDGVAWHLLLVDRCHVDVSGLTPYHVKSLIKAKIPIVHLARHPVPSINSLIKYKPFGVVDFDTACNRWYECHRKMSEAGGLEANNSYGLYNFIRLEDMELFFPHLCGKLHIPFVKESICVDRGRSTPSTEYVWDDLPWNVKNLAITLGYGGANV